jgi:hypothetical protein
MRVRISATILFLLMLACVEPYEIKTNGSTRLLVIEGVLSDQLKRHQIFLSRATAVGDRKLVREGGATVTISDQMGNTIVLEEPTPGIYETPEFAAEVGMSYTLHITTADGSEYSSNEVPFKNGASLTDVYAKYVDNPHGEGKGMQIYVDTEDPTGQSGYYRWNYVEAYEVHAPFPSNWVWLGGNAVDFRHDGIDTCYATDTLRHILIRNTRSLDADKIVGQEIRYIPEYSHILRHKYTILVQQFSLSEEAYLYWENLKTISESQGSLSDVQPGSVPGNIFSLSQPDEPVLGYFEACAVSEKRISFKPIDFYDVGFVRPPEFRSYCYDIAPILVPQAELGTYMQLYGSTMYIWEVFGMEPAATFELMPRTCCDCRDQGPTERPSYFDE